MFFRERTTDWVAPQLSSAVATVLLITLVGVFYLGIFGDNVIKLFKNIPVASGVKAEIAK
jgi:hypothetical protein